MRTITVSQQEYFWDLFAVLRTEFARRRGHDPAGAFFGWLAGVVNRDKAEDDGDAVFVCEGDVRTWVETISSWRARRVIHAMKDIRDRWRRGSGLDREEVRTPPAMLRAIHAGARSHGVDRDTLAEIVWSVTQEETRSTGCLTWKEASAVLDRLNGKAGRVVRAGKVTTETQRAQSESDTVCEVVEDLFGEGRG